MEYPFKNKKQAGAILSFGELLLRICPDAEGQWLDDNVLPFYVGGAELNVATALALWGLPSKYFTVLPGNHLSAQIIAYLQKKNIDTGPVFYDGLRIGLYFLTKGRDMKHNALIYDRAHSAFAGLETGMVDWDMILEDVSWFHFSAICPAVSQKAADVCKEALEAASKRNITISVDLNYRAKLWQYGRSPLEVMPDLVQYCDLVMGNIWAAETMLGIAVPAGISERTEKSGYLDAAKLASDQIIQQYDNCQVVANTFRFDGGDEINYYTTLYTGDNFYHSNPYQTTRIVDKVGSGDCFMAGLIYGFNNAMSPADTLEFATAAAFEKLFIESDATNQTVDQIKKAIK